MRKPRKFTNLNGKEAEFKKAYNELVDYVLATTPLSTPNSLVTRTTQGTNIRPKAPSASSKGFPMVFRGEWVEGMADVVAGNCVVIRGGTNAGSYIAVVNAPTGDPWDSEDWVQFPTYNTTGTWT